jgi:hypothetical protein
MEIGAGVISAANGSPTASIAGNCESLSGFAPGSYHSLELLYNLRQFQELNPYE